MSEEENRDSELVLLQAEAKKVDADNNPEHMQPGAPGAEPPVPEQHNEAAEISALLQIMAGVAAPMFPSIRTIYTTETCDAIGQAAQPVMIKRGWSTSAVLGQYGEELALLAVVGPVAMATYSAVKADIAAAEKAKTKAAEELGNVMQNVLRKNSEAERA